ncbi:MAG: hypothetical protein LC745_06600 [Planctomycetia bacterium]|nr:hypothetical protein [Planctomycetia bacterium]
MLTPSILTLWLLAQSPPPRPEPAGPYEPKAGDLAYLDVRPGSPFGPRPFFYLSAPGKAAWERLNELNKGDAAGPVADAPEGQARVRREFMGMAAEGLVFVGFANTKVRVVAPHPELTTRAGGDVFYPVEIQVVEGPRQGLRLFISNRCVSANPNTGAEFNRALATAKANYQNALQAERRRTERARAPKATQARTPLRQPPREAQRAWAEQETLRAQTETTRQQQDSQALDNLLQRMRQQQQQQIQQQQWAEQQRQSNGGVTYDRHGVIVP